MMKYLKSGLKILQELPSLLKEEAHFYVIRGTDKEAIARCTKDMRWLQSMESDFVGLDLLKKARDLHDRPVEIIAQKYGKSSYVPKQHRIYYSTSHLDHVKIKGSDNQYYSYSGKRFLGHELTHAGQADIAEAADLTREQLRIMKMKESQYIFEHVTPEKFQEFTEKELAAKETPYYWQARKLLKEVHEEFIVPRDAWVKQETLKHPKLRPLFEKFETEAIANENKVAAKLNEPLRSVEDYFALGPTPEQRLNQMLLLAGAEKKIVSPFAEQVPVVNKEWVKQLRSGALKPQLPKRPLHPRIQEAIETTEFLKY